MSEALREKPQAEEVPETAGPGIIRDSRYMPPPDDGDGKLWVRHTMLIQGEPDELYRLWRKRGSCAAVAGTNYQCDPNRCNFIALGHAGGRQDDRVGFEDSCG